MTHTSRRKTETSKTVQSPQHDQHVEWMQLSEKVHDRDMRYGQACAPASFATHTHEQGDRSGKQHWIHQKHRWAGEDGSEETILPADQEHIMVTTELKITRDSEDIAQAGPQVESDAV